jgi:hypothetical protein
MICILSWATSVLDSTTTPALVGISAVMTRSCTA